ncbi:MULTISPECIES: tripartite tricarboxylate transporter substrate binding protein [unclassified Cupriavidus]|uniref:tripartite tricarboxylate transporter substrate binding protein n=1 Tax=unclassified Cupriavidus TaxID=2640874 RepID=UPI000B88C0DD|nr:MULTISPECIES: tripartite tricarboxylate transporter substrate binding protein [unclassified Cupriavidus]
MPEVRKRSRLWRGKTKLPTLAASPAAPRRSWRAVLMLPAFLGAAVAFAQPPVGLATAQFASIPNGSRPELLNRSVSFPARPIRMIVPFPAGGVADATARLLAERLAVRLGVPVEVDNRPGAAGTMAGDVVAKSSSDGHTLLFHQANMLIQPGLEPVPYDVVRDFTPVARVATMPLFLVIDGRLPMQTPQQWVTAVRSSPGSYSYGYGQPGSPSQFYAEYAVRGIPSGVPLVTAKGEAAVVLEMLAGRISACFCSYTAVQNHVRSGALRLLGVTGGQRSPLAPQVPTLQEAGVDGYGATAWYGVMAPAKTPRAIVARLATELDNVTNEREVRARLMASGLTAVRDSPEAFATAIRADTLQWQMLVRQSTQGGEP